VSDPDDFEMIGRLVRRIAGPNGPPRAGSPVLEFDLDWNITVLRYGLREGLPPEHSLHAQARDAEEGPQPTLPVWRAVAALPWRTVERIVMAIEKQRGVWDLEDHLG
jgi:hypothetical protein